MLFSDIMEGLLRLNYQADPQEVDLWMKRYAFTGQISEVKFSQFCKSFDPHDNYYSTLMNRRVPQLTGELGVFSADTQHLYKTVWLGVLSDEGISEGQRQRF